MGSKLGVSPAASRMHHDGRWQTVATRAWPSKVMCDVVDRSAVLTAKRC